jgi:glycosyltransferase involved in cell wall biosynthesis
MRSASGNRRPFGRVGTATRLICGVRSGIDAGSPDVWIVVQAVNEAGVIGDVIADVHSVFDHVVCLEDGSSDGPGKIALRAGAHPARHPVKLGQGATIQTGVVGALSRM